MQQHFKQSNLLQSFWMAGFECADQLNYYGNRVDLLHATGHIDAIAEDYMRLHQFGIRTVREGIRWSRVETRPYHYDFRVLGKMIRAGQQCGIQQLWDICHFGFPDDLSPLHPHFSRRFVSLCTAFVSFYRKCVPGGRLIVTPINEVSFLSWLGGEHGATAPYCRRMGWDLKYALMGAYIKAVAAMKAIDPQVVIMTTEPLVNIVPPLNASPQEELAAAREHYLQYQVLDMLSGTICPELGGKPQYLELLGFNYYYNNQWIYNYQEFLPWANLEPDPRWRGLSSLLAEASMRYNRPLLISETSHPGEHRPDWLIHLTGECEKALDLGIDLCGICLYPIIDRPDWDHLQHWHHSGLWDASAADPGARILCEPYADALLQCQAQLCKLYPALQGT